jgi:hypothetical protein
VKKKQKYFCPLCACTQTRTLSAEAAVQIHEFLEVIAANFMAIHGRKICHNYEQRAKRNINVHEPWKSNCTGEPF